MIRVNWNDEALAFFEADTNGPITAETIAIGLCAAGIQTVTNDNAPTLLARWRMLGVTFTDPDGEDVTVKIVKLIVGTSCNGTAEGDKQWARRIMNGQKQTAAYDLRQLAKAIVPEPEPEPVVSPPIKDGDFDVEPVDDSEPFVGDCDHTKAGIEAPPEEQPPPGAMGDPDPEQTGSDSDTDADDTSDEPSAREENDNANDTGGDEPDSGDRTD